MVCLKKEIEAKFPSSTFWSRGFKHLQKNGSAKAFFDSYHLPKNQNCCISASCKGLQEKTLLKKWPKNVVAYLRKQLHCFQISLHFPVKNGKSIPFPVSAFPYHWQGTNQPKPDGVDHYDSFSFQVRRHRHCTSFTGFRYPLLFQAIWSQLWSIMSSWRNQVWLLIGEI